MISNIFKIHGLAFMAGHRRIMAVIYMGHGVSHINHNLVHRRVSREGETVHINTPKTKAGERVIPMIRQVYDAFLEEFELQQLTGFCRQKIEGKIFVM